MKSWAITLYERYVQLYGDPIERNDQDAEDSSAGSTDGAPPSR